jgi:hypothetical protein
MKTPVSSYSQVPVEKSRSQELAELAQLTKVINSPPEGKDIIAHLVDSIKPILNI